MIACLPPSDQYLDENISTLTYATKASYIANEPNRNEDPRMKIIHQLRKKVTDLEKELQAANDHIKFLTSLTGGQIPQKGNLFNDNKPSVFEQEVRINDRVPPALHKGGSTTVEDDIVDNMRRELKMNHLNSTPVDDPTNLNDDSMPEEYKSDAIENSGVLSKKGSKKKGAKAKGKKDEDCKFAILTHSQQLYCKS